MIILALPFRNRKKLISQYKKYNSQFPWLEYRVDFNADLESLPTEIINNRSIITIRDKSENGKHSISFKKKIEYYKDCIKKSDCLVDLELNLYNNYEVPENNLILSYHNFNSSLDLNYLESIVNKSNSIPSKFLKIAVPINSYCDLNEIKKNIALSNKPVIFAGLGELSRQSRILYKHLGATGTFVGLNNDKVFEDQLSVSEACQYNLASITNKTKVTGIIGGKQIYESLGLKLYNEFFQKRNLNAVYIPFHVKDFRDFWKWSLTCKEYIVGYSITMPHKKEVSNLLNNKTFITNLYISTDNQVFNTDLIAFEKSISHLKPQENSKILILGTGSTAETALMAFKEFKHVHISGRNFSSGKLLAKKYGRSFVDLSNLSTLKFKILVNCTPLGMASENPLLIFNISCPQQVIDLPYCSVTTPLIEKCINKNIQYVDGKMFWLWQAEYQIDEFSKWL